MRNIHGTKSLLTDISHITEKYLETSEINFIFLKNEKEINQIREASYLIRDLLFQLHKVIKPAVNELDIAIFCENYILIRGAHPSVISISKNNVAFHGIPENSQLVEGDILTVDIVLLKNGWFGDGAWTYTVGNCCESTKKLIQFASDVIYKAVDFLKETEDLASIGKVVTELCGKSDFRVLNEGAGHGIGRSLHEDPEILFTPYAETQKIVTGMVFTIEPVITDSHYELQYSGDGCAYLKEGLLTAQFEHMIAVNENGLEILTDRKPLFK